MRQATQSNTAFASLLPYTKVEKHGMLDIKAVKSKGVTVVPWDGT